MYQKETFILRCGTARFGNLVLRGGGILGVGAQGLKVVSAAIAAPSIDIGDMLIGGDLIVIAILNMIQSAFNQTEVLDLVDGGSGRDASNL